MTLYWLTPKALEALHGPDRCATCSGSEWVAIEDPLYRYRYIDIRCPECVHTKGWQQ